MEEINIEMFLENNMLSKEEQDSYRELFDSEDFEAFIKKMHITVFRDAVRQIIFACFKEGVPAEVVNYNLAYMWLQGAKILVPKFSEDIVDNWLVLDQQLGELLYQISEDALMITYDSRPEIAKQPYDLDLESMCENWRAHIRFTQEVLSVTAYQELNGAIQTVFINANKELSKSSQLHLTPADIHSIWSELLVQTYVFSTPGKDPQYYYHASKLWTEDIYEFMGGDFLELLVFLEGNEHLLTAENRHAVFNDLLKLRAEYGDEESAYISETEALVERVASLNIDITV